MTNSYRPLIRTQAEVHTMWRHLVRPLGFRRRGLWLMLIDADDRPAPVVTEVTDLPEQPEAGPLDGLAEMLRHLGPEAGAGRGRWALLMSRPGRHRPDHADHVWVAALYDVLRRHAIAHDVVHLASDSEIVPVPLDDVSGYLQAS